MKVATEHISRCCMKRLALSGSDVWIVRLVQSAHNGPSRPLDADKPPSPRWPEQTPRKRLFQVVFTSAPDLLVPQKRWWHISRSSALGYAWPWRSPVHTRPLERFWPQVCNLACGAASHPDKELSEASLCADGSSVFTDDESMVFQLVSQASGSVVTYGTGFKPTALNVTLEMDTGARSALCPLRADRPRSWAEVVCLLQLPPTATTGVMTTQDLGSLAIPG